MNTELIDRMGEFVCGYRLREEDAAIIRAAIAALSATPQAAQVPEGYALVPINAPSDWLNEMVDAAFKGGNRYVALGRIALAWSAAMRLAAAQAQGVGCG